MIAQRKKFSNKPDNSQPQSVFSRSPDFYMNFNGVKCSYLFKQSCQLLVSCLTIILYFVQAYSKNIKEILPIVIINSYFAFNIITSIYVISNCAWVLLNQPPPEVDTTKIKNKISEVEGVIEVLYLFVYCMSDKTIAAYISVSTVDKYCVMKIRDMLNGIGIHETLIDTNFIERDLKYFSEPIKKDGEGFV